jgi:hypothetical protein
MSKKRLSHDLAVLEAMAAEMVDYLKSDVLFWQMARGNMPKLTLGGYLMRQHRLLHLSALLDEAEQQRLQTAVAQFDAALVEKVVRLEQKIHTELGARIRQWGEYLKDVQAQSGASGYGTAVEARAMIAAMTDKLQSPPYQLQPRILDQVGLLDRSLRQRWQPGEFVWPSEWMPAYPEETYWWLYGRPQ